MNAEEIRQNIPIFEVAERLGITGNLRAAGDNEMRGPCPLHGGDNRDAFSMYQDSSRWECRTHCGKGSQIDLVMKAQGVDVAGALRWINEAFHLEAGNGSHPQAARPQPKPARIEQKEPKPDGSSFSDVYAGFLSLLDDPQPDGYLTRARGVTVDTLKRNGVKQISEARRQTIKKDMAELFPIDRLKACGLFPISGKTGKTGKTYFIFWACDYVYSFHDQAGRVVYLQGVTAERHRAAKTGKYVYLQGIEKPVLYLPLDFMTWRPGDDPIITEAVLDALSAVDLGLNAVAIPDTGGMKKATAADLEPLRPFRCRILGDNDIPGMLAKQALFKTMIESGYNARRESWKELCAGLGVSGYVKDFNELLKIIRGAR